VPNSLTFSEVLEAADRLPSDEQEDLIAILRRRLIDRERQRLVAEVRESRDEFAGGGCRPSTVGDLMDEILS
jgi:hypothetical protein